MNTLETNPIKLYAQAGRGESRVTGMLDKREYKILVSKVSHRIPVIQQLQTAKSVTTH
jgi:hypothetical protein